MKRWWGSITLLRTFAKHLLDYGENHIQIVEVHKPLYPADAIGLN